MPSPQRSTPWTPSSSGSWASEGAARVLALGLLAALLLAAPAARAETRVALVIGNAAYASLEPLRNPVNDATDIAEALEALDFEVMRGNDLGRAEMIAHVEAFAEAAREADVSLFYYAGHGFQIDDENYLVPVDAAFRRREDVAGRTLALERITEALEGVGGTRLVFLDACRDNPVAFLLDGAPGGLRDGLARIGDAAGFLFAFSTQPDNVAFDGLGRNSYFAGSLLSHLHTAGQDVSATMIAVRKDVLAATGGRQVPWENSSLTQRFQFRPGEPADSPEAVLWQVAVKAQDPALLNVYLDRYPEGAHAEDVRRLLAEAAHAELPDGAEPATRSLPTDGVEQQLWDVARRLRTPELVELYLDRYPEGDHAGEALRLLGLLPQADAHAAAGPLCERLATHPRDATAGTAGVPMARLAQHADAAIEACARAAELQPELPRFTALLARAEQAAGRTSEAVALYRDAAQRGDLRAMVSLALMAEAGDGVPKDPDLALSLYERAAEGGNPDGAINLAVALFNGAGVERDAERAERLLRDAAEAGSGEAAYNLGVLALRGLAGGMDAALDHFERAIELGWPMGYVASAILLDAGEGAPRDPAAAADMLLRGAALDRGRTVAELTSPDRWAWSPETVEAIQVTLRAVGVYDGFADGAWSPELGAALERWRTGDFFAEMHRGWAPRRRDGGFSPTWP